MSQHRFSPCRWSVLALALLVLPPLPAAAQLRGTIAVGGGVSAAIPSDSELKKTVRVTPTFRRLPRQGWGVAAGFNWYEVDVREDFVSSTDRLGRLSVRPLMAGIGYTAVWDRFSLSPSLVAGPAWNRLTIDEVHRAEIGVGGSEFGRRADKVTFVVRPSVTATYALAPRFGLTASGGYLFNKPEFRFQTPSGVVEAEWSANVVTLHAGIVVSLF